MQIITKKIEIDYFKEGQFVIAVHDLFSALRNLNKLEDGDLTQWTVMNDNKLKDFLYKENIILLGTKGGVRINDRNKFNDLFKFIGGQV